MKTSFAGKIQLIILTIIISSFCFQVPLDAQDKKSRNSARKASVETSSDKISDPVYYFMEGLRFYNLLDHDKAEFHLLRSLELDENNDAAYYYLSNIYIAKNDLEKGEIYLRRALDIDPSNYWYRINLAQFYARTDRSEVAIRLYEDLKKDYPKKSSLYYDMIYLYAEAQQIDKAIETLNHIENVGGRNDLTAVTRWELLNMQKRYEEANNFILGYGSESTSARISYIMGDIYMQQYNDTLALASYSKALSFDPTYTPAYFGSAEIYRMRRQYDKFFEHIIPFMSSSETNPQMKVRYLNEAVLSPNFIAAFRTETDSLINCMYKAHPLDTNVAFMAGSYFVATGSHDKGIEIYDQNLSNHPDSHSSIAEYIYILSYLERWDELFEVAQKGLKTFPDDQDILQSIGIAYWNKGDLPKSIEIYHKIEKMASDGSAEKVNAYSILGDLYHQSGNSKRSFSYYEKVLKIDPQNAHALNNYAYYLSQTGKNLKKALEMSKKTLDQEPNNTTYLDTYGWILYLMERYDEAKATFKHAINYGGKESAVLMDHYGDVLNALGDHILAEVYWENANKMDPTLGINKKKISTTNQNKR